MNKLNKILCILVLVLFVLGLAVVFKDSINYKTHNIITSNSLVKKVTESISPTKKPNFALPERKILSNGKQYFQTFNNCGPASLSMALSYYGINATQEEIGNNLRPYQIPGGDNDDKSTTLEELAKKATDYNLMAFHRPNGNVELVKQFIANDIPVVTRTWLKKDDDIGHYRVIKGYDSSTEKFIQDDSLQGANLEYTYEDFSTLWKKFNYEYLVLVPKEKLSLANQILGEDFDEKKSWQKAVSNAKQELANNPGDIYVRFNLSVALYNTGNFEESVLEFEKIQNSLPFRTLWYQIEPIQAYYELGEYTKVLNLTDEILNNHNRAFSELYVIRGNIYKKLGDIPQARSEFEKAVLYNSNLEEAQQALSTI